MLYKNYMMNLRWINLDFRKTLSALPSASALRMLLQHSKLFWSARLSQNRIFSNLLSSCRYQNQFITKISPISILKTTATNYSTDNRKSKDQEYQSQDHLRSEFQPQFEKVNRKKNQVKHRNVSSDSGFEKVDSGTDESSNVPTKFKIENESNNTQKNWNWNEILSILRTAEAGLRIFRSVFFLLKKMTEGGRQGGVTRSGSEAVFGPSTMTRKPDRKKRDTSCRW